jgi:DNA repair protein RecN (Recombination protein N)
LIRTLRVRNLAVIEELELELGPGLNVLTGETGAGKSVLLSAIALLCGRRVSAEAIRSGETDASVHAILDSPVLLARAKQLGLASDDDEELLVVRSLSREGRGRVHVNGGPATIALLAELMADALEVASQGEHQRLLRPDVQTELLDAYAGIEAEVASLGDLYAEWRRTSEQLHERLLRGEERARRADQLRFEIEQIEAAAPRPGELDELEQERARLGYADRLAGHAAAAAEALERDGGVREELARARSEVESAARLDPSLEPIAEGIERARVEAEEAALEIERYRSALESDPARLEYVEGRLGELGRLQSRYGPTIEAILEYRDRARDEFEDLDGGEQRIAELERARAEAGAELERAASGLGRARRAAAEQLQAEVESELRALELGRAEFRVRLEALRSKTAEGEAAPSGPRGQERAAFLLAANAGEEPRRLRDAASGGELSRLLLALRNVLRDADGGRVLLFDEIDAGVGGRTANRVGERLRRLGGAHQILCITHLPQVAALAQTHYAVYKRTRAGRTRTGVEPLRDEARVEEIARMSAGGRVTDAARAHARELLSAR